MIHMNRISGRNNPDHKFHTFLFMLREGIAFTDDLANDDTFPSVSDLTQRVVMRELRGVKDIGGTPASQIFFPGNFEMRVVLHCNAPSIELKSTSKADAPFNAFFSDMQVTQASTPMKATRAPKKNGMQQQGEQVDDGDVDSMS